MLRSHAPIRAVALPLAAGVAQADALSPTEAARHAQAGFGDCFEVPASPNDAIEPADVRGSVAWFDAAFAKRTGSRAATNVSTNATAEIVETSRVPFVIVPLVTADDDQHAANADVRIGDSVEGVGTVHGLLARAP